MKTMVELHEWKPPFSAASDLCGATVMRNGGGDECGLPRDHAVHLRVVEAGHDDATTCPGCRVAVRLNNFCSCPVRWRG